MGVTKRKNVANEILHTEKEYTGNLGILVESFLKPALEKENAKYLEAQLNNEIVLSLSGVEVIYKFHVELLHDLDDKIKTWSPSSQLGALILPMAFYLKSYSTYVNHYQNVVQLLAKRKTDKNLQNMLESLKPQAAGKGIKDYLIMPIQRIPRYQMLLHELVKATWASHADIQNLVQAQAKVQEVAVALENQSADASSIAKVMELATTFSFGKEFSGYKLVVPHRRYIDDTGCNGGLIAFLFNDLLVITKPKKEKQVVKQMIKLSDCNVDANDDSTFELKVAGEENASSLTIEESEFTTWKNYFESIKNGDKIWLPHTIEKDDTTISVLKRAVSDEVVPPTPPPLPTKSHFKNFMGAIRTTMKLVQDDSKRASDVSEETTGKSPKKMRKSGKASITHVEGNKLHHDTDEENEADIPRSSSDLDSSIDSIPPEVMGEHTGAFQAITKNRVVSEPASYLKDIESLQFDGERLERAEQARDRLERKNYHPKHMLFVIV